MTEVISPNSIRQVKKILVNHYQIDGQGLKKWENLINFDKIFLQKKKKNSKRTIQVELAYIHYSTLSLKFTQKLSVKRIWNNHQICYNLSLLSRPRVLRWGKKKDPSTTP